MSKIDLCIKNRSYNVTRVSRCQVWPNLFCINYKHCRVDTCSVWWRCRRISFLCHDGIFEGRKKQFSVAYNAQESFWSGIRNCNGLGRILDLRIWRPLVLRRKFLCHDVTFSLQLNVGSSIRGSAVVSILYMVPTPSQFHDSRLL